MFDRRRYVGSFAVFALVLLRLVIGWHFFHEGTKKLEYDRHDGDFELASDFTSEDFLTQAKGPLAELYRSNAADGHDWRDLLATPRQNVPPTEDEAVKQAQWAADYARRRGEAAKKDEISPAEFSPFAPYYAWAEQIREDWQGVLADVKSIPGLTDDEKRQADAAYNSRLQQVADYLAGEAEAITEYRHELWRLENWRKAPEAGEAPFHDARITAKAAETAGKPAAWIKQVDAFEADYHSDLRSIVRAEQRKTAHMMWALDDALTDSRHDRLRMVDLAVAGLTIGVGVCLLLGMFTRLASIAGALFLLAVIASQPPWLAEAAPTMSQIIEFAGLLVLAGTKAGRWAGLDFFTYALFNRKRSRDVVS